MPRAQPQPRARGPPACRVLRGHTEPCDDHSPKITRCSAGVGAWLPGGAIAFAPRATAHALSSWMTAVDSRPGARGSVRHVRTAGRARPGFGEARAHGRTRASSRGGLVAPRVVALPDFERDAEVVAAQVVADGGGVRREFVVLCVAAQLVHGEVAV